MKSTILGIGEWRPPTKRLNAEWDPAIVDGWRERAKAHAEALRGTGIDEGALNAQPDLTAADALSVAGFRADAEDVFLHAKERFVADPSTTSMDGHVHAGRAALEDAGVQASDVDVVICWDAIPDRPGCPGAPKVAERLGAHRAHAFDIQQACASVISSLQLAAALVESGRARHVLLTQAHIAFRFFGFATPVAANVGDIATGLVVGASELPGVHSTSLLSDGSFQSAVIIARGRDDATDTPWFTPGGAFFFGTKDRAGAQQMMKDTVRMGELTIREACDRGRIDPAHLDVVCAPHPRRWIPGAIAQSLGLPSGSAPETYQQTGHVGGCGTVANLVEARRRGMLKPGSKVALYAQGQGMTRAAAIIHWGAR